ncbi:MAG: hypothetical protein A2928_01380 [Candidatus Taylorbacteria bacterium RIFCSPLOWO2_01_FULL_45_15b]|uniref:5'-deoxynucleotidase n=1 Tax=Candidatus Taylorbacteria bacterium RIFCSPLOWO2_01_FULL_45_15b TaxID=1802319 RepID=A0A1G2N7L9_9BACT|nr:MAG: hypothetical protein A2928_01380 [Candidatus Taylorbacteria bacterium RIFCSPLOWO2_01_FULL_45_15b]
MNLKKAVKFLEFLHLFQDVERKILKGVGKNQLENDAEHSFQLALLAWYLVSSNNLKMNSDKVLRYAMVHDLVEAYAGDTYIYGSKKGIETKKMRERRALKKIQKNFTEFPELSAWILAYEKRDDAESRFVYALDKIIPVLNIRADGGRAWKKFGVTLRMLQDAKNEKIAVSPDAEALWHALVHELKKREYALFPRKSFQTKIASVRKKSNRSSLRRR